MKIQISLRTSRTWCELGKQNILANKVYSSLFAVKKPSQGMNCSCNVRFSFLHIIGVKRHGGIWVSYCQVWKKFQCYCDWLLQIGNLQEMCQRLTIVKSSIKSWPMLAYSSDLEGAGSEAMLLGRCGWSGCEPAFPCSTRLTTSESRSDNNWYDFFSLIGLTTHLLFAFGKQSLYRASPARSPDFITSWLRPVLALLSRAASWVLATMSC